MPWWGWLLIVLAALGAGVVIGAAGALLYAGRGPWQ